MALWARVMHAVPGSRLLLKAPQLTEPSVRQHVKQHFAAHAIDGARLILETQVPRADYLKPFNRVDIALDPFPYTGITTSVETLWMGVPFITLAGRTFLTRQGVGLLTNAGLSEWIAASPDDYVDRAARHAADVETLQRIRRDLRARLLASPIFDAARFAGHFEDALRGMWRTWCNAQPG
jgi:predicted O-linked N-acetylglucosamine transferase (SPINDLY family)